MKHILFIDDDIDLLNLARQYFLTFDDYKLTTTPSGKEGLHLIKSVAYDAIVLDVKLDDMNGNDICEIARNYTNAPILMLSNNTAYQSRIQGLTRGADDYICKPFSFDELKVRIELRIAHYVEDRPAECMRFNDLTIDTGTLKATYKQAVCQFSLVEFSILVLLARHPERVFSYEQIYACVWKEPINASKHTLQARVAELRIKLNTLCNGMQYIDTIRGKGYRFNPFPCESDNT